MILRPAEPRDCAAICAFWNPMLRESEVTFNSVTKSTEDLAVNLGHQETKAICVAICDHRGEVFGGFGDRIERHF